MIEPDPSDPGSTLLHVKAVPGASRDQIVGPMDLPDGRRLKIKASAPAESGKANKAIEKLIAAHLGLPAKSVTLTSGPTNPLKTFRIEGVSMQDLRARL
ncbi:MAG: DUF167 domain-containing protein [Phycisphaerales bacterium JB040]